MRLYGRVRQGSSLVDKQAKRQSEAASIENHLRSPTLMMLVLIAVLGSLLYASFLFNPQNRGDLLPYVLVVAAETFLLGQALLSLWTVLASSYDPRNFQFHAAQDKLFHKTKKVAVDAEAMQGMREPRNPMQLKGEPVSVGVFITTYGEDLAIIRATAIAAYRMRGRHATYILD